VSAALASQQWYLQQRSAHRLSSHGLCMPAILSVLPACPSHCPALPFLLPNARRNAEDIPEDMWLAASPVMEELLHLSDPLNPASRYDAQGWVPQVGGWADVGTGGSHGQQGCQGRGQAGLSMAVGRPCRLGR